MAVKGRTTLELDSSEALHLLMFLLNMREHDERGRPVHFFLAQHERYFLDDMIDKICIYASVVAKENYKNALDQATNRPRTESAASSGMGPREPDDH